MKKTVLLFSVIFFTLQAKVEESIDDRIIKDTLRKYKQKAQERNGDKLLTVEDLIGTYKPNGNLSVETVALKTYIIDSAKGLQEKQSPTSTQFLHYQLLSEIEKRKSIFSSRKVKIGNNTICEQYYHRTYSPHSSAYYAEKKWVICDTIVSMKELTALAQQVLNEK